MRGPGPIKHTSLQEELTENSVCTYTWAKEGPGEDVWKDRYLEAHTIQQIR